MGIMLGMGCGSWRFVDGNDSRMRLYERGRSGPLMIHGKGHGPRSPDWYGF